MTEAEPTANPPAEEVKAEPAMEEQKPEVASAEAKTEAEEPVAKEEAEVKEETETKEEPAVKDEPAAKEEAAEDKKDVEANSGSILKTQGKIDFHNPRNNRKFDPSTREVTDDPVSIRKQVEFYFGDWNFPQDKFMWEQCEGAENKPIAISKIHSFKRMRSFQPYSAVVTALRDSTFLVVEGEEGEETIKRKFAYKPAPAGKTKTDAATVYVKGFGDEQPNTQFDLESFFSQYGDVRGLKLRRTNENFFKGSVFVTFADEKEADAFMNYKPAPKWKDHDLKIMSKRAYCDDKAELIRQGKLEPNTQHHTKFFEGKDGKNRGGRGGNRGGFRGDNDDWKRRRDYDQKGGFRDNRGRGRGRGGRGGRGRGDRFRDRNGEGRREEREKGDSAPVDKAAESLNSKRAREDDGPSEEPVAKKVDVKDS